MSDSLGSHELQHGRLPCPAQSARVCSNSCPLNRWCHPTIAFSVIPFSSCLQSFWASGSFPKRQLFQWGFRWPKYWSFSFSISPSSKYSGLISCGDDWFYLLGVQGTLKCLLQHHNSKVTILQHSSIFTVQLSHAYMTTGETKALTAAAAAKSLQSCPTLCDPIDSSPPGSPVPGIPQAKTLEWVAISFSSAWEWKVKVKLLRLDGPFSAKWCLCFLMWLPYPGSFHRSKSLL